MQSWDKLQKRYSFQAWHGKDFSETWNQQAFPTVRLARHRKRIEQQNARLYAIHETIKKPDLKPFISPPKE